MNDKENTPYNGLVGVDFKKYTDRLIPVIVQDASTNTVLMLGFMNEEALNTTIKSKLVTFYSRSKRRLWVKGETSKNYLHLVDIKTDCDKDAILVKANPDGPVCHTGADTCFNEKNIDKNFLTHLEHVIQERKESDSEDSYVSSLFRKGINKIAQKVGEEAVELVIEAKDNDEDKFKNEAADLLFHYLVLLNAKKCNLNDIVKILKERHLNN
jgi:phosphoribosyl-ATP pyrophosphohydrolase/phosphoribosyl-AMP cyclohydrolase